MESTWVRSVYLYAMCAIAIVLVAGGAVMAVVATTNIIAPDLGHRDNIDRVGVGMANVAVDVVQILSGQSDADMQEIEDYCQEWADEDEFDRCVDEMSGASQIDAVADGIGALKGEIESQIRNTAIARLIRAVLLIVAGWLLWHVHARRTELYRDGLRPRKAAAPAVVLAAGPTSVPGAAPAAPTPTPAPPLPPTPPANGSSGEW